MKALLALALAACLLPVATKQTPRRDCLTCHDGTISSPAYGHEGVACVECHVAPRRQCLDCHPR